MTVKLRFRDISGRIINGSFSNDAKVEDICHFLNDRLKSRNNIIYLISPRPKQLFYKNGESIQVLVKQNKKSIFFFSLNQSTAASKNEIQKKMITPPKSAMNAYNNFMEIKNIGRDHRSFYFKYASVLKNVPTDIEERVKQVAQFGYDTDDCREALRDANFDVNEAVEILIRRHRNLTDEEANEPPPNYNSIFRFIHFMLSRHHSRSDDDDSDEIEEEDSSEDSSDNNNDNNNSNDENTASNDINENNNEAVPNTEPNNTENEAEQNRSNIIRTPMQPSSASTSPRTSINRLRADSTQDHRQLNQNPSDENLNRHQKARPIIINPRLNRITRPNIQSNQRKITLPKNVQPKK